MENRREGTADELSQEAWLTLHLKQELSDSCLTRSVFLTSELFGNLVIAGPFYFIFHTSFFFNFLNILTGSHCMLSMSSGQIYPQPSLFSPPVSPRGLDFYGHFMYMYMILRVSGMCCLPLTFLIVVTKFLPTVNKTGRVYCDSRVEGAVCWGGKGTEAGTGSSWSRSPRWVFPPLPNLSGNILKDTRRRISMVILNPIRLAMKTKHWRERVFKGTRKPSPQREPPFFLGTLK